MIYDLMVTRPDRVMTLGGFKAIVADPDATITSINGHEDFEFCVHCDAPILPGVELSTPGETVVNERPDPLTVFNFHLNALGLIIGEHDELFHNLAHQMLDVFVDVGPDVGVGLFLGRLVDRAKKHAIHQEYVSSVKPLEFWPTQVPWAVERSRNSSKMGDIKDPRMSPSLCPTCQAANASQSGFCSRKCWNEYYGSFPLQPSAYLSKNFEQHLDIVAFALDNNQDLYNAFCASMALPMRVGMSRAGHVVPATAVLAGVGEVVAGWIEAANDRKTLNPIRDCRACGEAMAAKDSDDARCPRHAIKPSDGSQYGG